jgi:uncharacterized protein (TIGR02147 family)
MKAAISVFQFHNYRSFMVAHFERTKAKNSAWSYQAWAKKIGLSNNTSLLKILNGSRDAGPQIQTKLENYFSLKGRELDYFRALVALAKAEANPEEKSLWTSRLAQLHPQRQYQFLDDSTFSLISHWYGYAVRQMTFLKNFCDDPTWIAKQFIFKITPREVKATVEALTKLELLTRDPDTGQMRATQGSLNTSDDIASESLKRHHEAVLENARLALRAVPPQERQISGFTLAIRADQIAAAKVFIREFEDQFINRFRCHENADAVYQTEIAFFPLTKMNQKESK